MTTFDDDYDYREKPNLHKDLEALKKSAEELDIAKALKIAPNTQEENIINEFSVVDDILEAMHKRLSLKTLTMDDALVLESLSRTYANIAIVKL